MPVTIELALGSFAVAVLIAVRPASWRRPVRAASPITSVL